MMRMLRWMILIASAFVLSEAIAQPCAPMPRTIDKQFALPDGRLLHCTGLYNGHMLYYPNDHWTFLFNYVLFSPEGEIVADSTVEIGFKGRNYVFYECKANYERNINFRYEPFIEYYCTMFEAYAKDSMVVVNLDLLGDPFNSNMIEISPDGTAEVIWYDLSYDAVPLYDEFSKFSWVLEKIETDYPDFKPCSQMNYVITDDSSTIQINGAGHIITNYFAKCISGCDAIYKIKFDETALEGFVLYEGRTPLITTTDNRVYITAFNTSVSNCEGYGPDTFPVTHCFDKKSGELIWKTENLGRPGISRRSWNR